MKKMIKDLAEVIIEFSPYLFPIADFLIWLMTGEPHALAGVFGNILNILLNLAIRSMFGSLFPGALWIYSPDSEDRGKCRVKEARWISKQGEIVEMPSLHAQQAAYYSTYWLVVLAYGVTGTNLPSLRAFISLILLQVFGFMICYARYTYAYSSLAQIITGYVIGVGWGLGYYYLIKYLVYLTTNNTAAF